MTGGSRLLGPDWDGLSFTDRQRVKAGRGAEVIADLQRRHRLYQRTVLPMRAVQCLVLTVVALAPSRFGGAWTLGSMVVAAALITLFAAHVLRELQGHRALIRSIEDYRPDQPSA